MTGQPVAAVDLAGDDVAVVVMSRTDGGCWRVESATGRDEDVAAVVAAADWPAPPPLPHREPGVALAELVREWMREGVREKFDLDDEQLTMLRRRYARQMATGALVHVTTADEPDERAGDAVGVHLSTGVIPERLRRYYADELLEAVNAHPHRRRHP